MIEAHDRDSRLALQGLLTLQGMGDVRAEDLREFVVWWKGEYIRHDKYVVHKSHVDAMRDAFVQLHHSPGVNPHNGEKTAEIWKLECGPLVANGPHWWTTPGLGKDKEAVGALLFGGLGRRPVWQHPELLAEIEYDRRRLMEAEERLVE